MNPSSPDSSTTTDTIQRLQQSLLQQQLAAETAAEASRNNSKYLQILAVVVGIATLLNAVFTYLNYGVQRELLKRQEMITLPVSSGR